MAEISPSAGGAVPSLQVKAEAGHVVLRLPLKRGALSVTRVMVEYSPVVGNWEVLTGNGFTNGRRRYDGALSATTRQLSPAHPRALVASASSPNYLPEGMSFAFPQILINAFATGTNE